MPVSAHERTLPQFEEGVSCPYCHGTLDEAKIDRLRERQKQMELAKEREQHHVGATMGVLREQKRQRLAQLAERSRLAQEQAEAQKTDQKDQPMAC